jgi:hypothetical protein
VLDVDGEAIAQADQRLSSGRGGVASGVESDLVADAQLAVGTADPVALSADAAGVES